MNRKEFSFESAAACIEGSSPFSSLSNTVCIAGSGADFSSVQQKIVKDLSKFGDIARLDMSLVVVSRAVLVTFFDVRCAQRVLEALAGRAEPYPWAAHDVRVVRVNIAKLAEPGFIEKLSQYGEVAHVGMHRGDVIIEFFDIRAAQLLLAAAGDAASPVQPQGKLQADSTEKNLLSALMACTSRLTGCPPGLSTSMPNLPSTYGAYESLAEDGSHEDESPNGKSAAEKQLGKNGERVEAFSNRPVRTKVTTKEFARYDIDPDKIMSGEDCRTTIMVRNLTGPRSRKDFLTFIDHVGLADRYTFLYMPCKEHRSVPAGFAFMNLVNAHDVQKLFVLVKSGAWRDFWGPGEQNKCPALSYARFQGHEELVRHFSTSAVLHENDVDKRPIFRPLAGQKDSARQQDCRRDGSTGGSVGASHLHKANRAARGMAPLLEDSSTSSSDGSRQNCLKATEAFPLEYPKAPLEYPKVPFSITEQVQLLEQKALQMGAALGTSSDLSLLEIEMAILRKQFEIAQAAVIEPAYVGSNWQQRQQLLWPCFDGNDGARARRP